MSGERYRLTWASSFLFFFHSTLRMKFHLQIKYCPMINQQFRASCFKFEYNCSITQSYGKCQTIMVNINLLLVCLFGMYVLSGYIFWSPSCMVYLACLVWLYILIPLRSLKCSTCQSILTCNIFHFCPNYFYFPINYRFF